ncbi:uncharacterized [Tachysurus ichikawai]
MNFELYFYTIIEFISISPAALDKVDKYSPKHEGPSDGLNIIIWQRSTIADSAAEADRWMERAIIMTQEDASNSELA